MSFSQALPCLYPHYTTAGIALQEKPFDKCRQKEPEIPCRCLHDKPADKIEADKREEKITALLLQLQLPFLFTFTLALTLTFTLGYFFRNRRFFILKPSVPKKKHRFSLQTGERNIKAAVQKTRA